jgi:hypothetical protein
MVTAHITGRGSPPIVMLLCPDGGIGRRAGFRCQWPLGRGGSSPLLGTIYNVTIELLN